MKDVIGIGFGMLGNVYAERFYRHPKKKSSVVRIERSAKTTLAELLRVITKDGVRILAPTPKI